MITAALYHCGPVRNLYIKKGYDSNAADAVKRINVVVMNYETDPVLARLILMIAGDHIKIRKNYSVSAVTMATAKPESRCSGVDGLAVFTIQKSELSGDDAELAIKGDLFRCPTMEILWHADGISSENSGVEDITSLIKIYQREFGETARIFAAVGFILLKEMTDTMPEPPSARGPREKVF